MFPPPKAKQAPKAQEWNDLEIRASLEDELESAKPASTASKKKKVKKLKKKKAGVNAENGDGEYAGPSGQKLDSLPDLNDSKGF